ncbi:Type 1 phosphatases regulator ypi1, variant 2 [Basidiobolus ranarum]
MSNQQTVSNLLARNSRLAGTASVTIDATSSQDITPLTSDNEEQFTGTIRLEGSTEPNRRVRWDESVVDNEGLGKKKSKICCIYSKPRAFGESDSDESDTESESDNERIHRTKRRVMSNAYERMHYLKATQG